MGLVVFAAIIVWLSRDALPILAMAGIVAFLVAPLVRLLHLRLRLPRWLALAVGYLVVLVVSLLLLAVLAVGITESLAGVDVAGMEDSARGVAEWFVEQADGLVVMGVSIDLSDVTDPVRDWLEDEATTTGTGGIKVDAETLQTILGGALNSIRTVAGLATAMVMSALITAMIAIYLSADSARLYRWVQRSVPPGYERDGLLIADRTGAIWRGYVYGQL